MTERTELCPNGCGNFKMPASTICTSCSAKKNALISLETKRIRAGANDEGRNCTKCQKFVLWKNFRNNLRGVNGKQSACKDCEKTYYKSMKHYLKKNNWNLSLWGFCYEYQKGICAIEGCKNNATHADHDHVTKEPRAILCRYCNISLGMMSENPVKIKGLARYAEQCQNVKLI